MAGRAHDQSLDGLGLLAPGLSAYADWCQPRRHIPGGVPLNGQPGRQELVRTIARSANPQAVIETGTYRGATTQFLWAVTGAPTWTVEVSPRNARFARWRLGAFPNITVCQADSRDFLRRLAVDERVPKDNVLFYLDAHWGPELPLREELIIIAQAWKNPAIMIDDFEVPGDTGYYFDDYGNGQRLSRDYIPLSEMGDFEVLYPTCPSAAEAGARRGCAVVVTSARAAAFTRDGVPLTSGSVTTDDSARNADQGR